MSSGESRVVQFDRGVAMLIEHDKNVPVGVGFKPFTLLMIGVSICCLARE